MRKSPRAAGLAVALLVTACTSSSPGPQRIAPRGPPVVELDAVERHARRLDGETPRRPAGSEPELVAATYILGNLQLAGYAVRLDSVPVANTVSSTNVIAVPPDGRKPEILVAAAYDSALGEPGNNGLALGVFLELARAMRVADPAHAVEFVALGAEHATVAGGHLGSRRMAELLRDEGSDVVVIVLDGVAHRGGLVVEGDGVGSLGSSGAGADSSLDPAALDTAGVFRRAVGEALVAGGGAEAVARALLRFLADEVG